MLDTMDPHGLRVYSEPQQRAKRAGQAATAHHDCVSGVPGSRATCTRGRECRLALDARSAALLEWCAARACPPAAAQEPRPMTDDVLQRLAAPFSAPRRERASKSYTRELLDGGPEHCAKKLGEESNRDRHRRAWPGHARA